MASFTAAPRAMPRKIQVDDEAPSAAVACRTSAQAVPSG